MDMEAVYRRCAGLDVHKDVIEVCVLPPAGQSGSPQRRRFATFTSDLIRLRMWLVSLKATEVAMESTGLYWVPVWRQLEGHIGKRLLCNPQQVKALAGRKSDRRDGQRIAEFLQDGRLDPSFVPPKEIQQLRELLRMRVSLVQEHNRLSNRVEKLLQSYGVKLSSVASDILGKTGQRILTALAAGQTDPDQLSWKAVGSLREKEAQLRRALRADFDEHSCWMLGVLLGQLKENEQWREQLEQRITEGMKPYEPIVIRLMTIPGVDRLTAWSMVAELGTDMSVFPDQRHCASWAGVCPGTNESAGKQHSTRTRRGNRYLRRILTQSAWATSRCKRGYLRAAFHRIAQRRGHKKAVVAIAHKILVAAYFIIRDQTTYLELGEDYFDLLHPERTARRLARRLERIGYQVTLTKAAATAPRSSEGQQPKKRGRPCKCAERGIDCKHKR
jgi:transposase